MIGIHGGKSYKVKIGLFLVESGTYFTFRTTGGSNELSVFQICLKSTKKTVSLVAMAETEQQSGKAQLKASAQH